MVDIKLVQYLAELSKINLTEQEMEELACRLQELIVLVDCIQEAEVTAALPEGEGTYIGDLRLDTLVPSLSISQLLRNAERTKEQSFGVSRIVQ